MGLLPLQYKGEVFHAYDAALRIGIKKQHPEHGAVQEETARAVAAVRRMGVHEMAVELALHPLLCAAGQGLGHLRAPGSSGSNRCEGGVGGLTLLIGVPPRYISGCIGR